MNTTELLTITSAIVPDRDAIIFDDIRLTFGELADRVNRLANAMGDLGVGAGRPGWRNAGQLQRAR